MICHARPRPPVSGRSQPDTASAPVPPRVRSGSRASEAVTRGIRVRASAVFAPEQARLNLAS
eukprot:6080685-Pleurochrysis_carterae.AAC.1